MSDPAADFIEDEWGDAMKRTPREEAIFGNGYAAGRLAALREVRKMVDALKIFGYSVDFRTAKRMALGGIDALIKREESGE